MTELDIIEGCRQGDNHSRHRLYNLYSEQMMAICFRYTGSVEISQDLLHDGFLKIFKSIQQFRHRGSGSLQAWMGQVFANIAIDYLKKNDVSKKIYFSDNWPEIDGGIEEETMNIVPDDVLMAFIAELPVGYRTVLNLFTFEDMPHKEIADLLKINESSSRSQLSRAKVMLAEKINRYVKQHE